MWRGIGVVSGGWRSDGVVCVAVVGICCVSLEGEQGLYLVSYTYINNHVNPIESPFVKMK